jgi:hypothetical protein
MNAAEFQPALIAGDLDALRRCPKADLHNQFILSGDRAFLAERTGRDIAPLNAPLASMEEMHAWVAHATGGLFDSAAGRVLAFEAAFVQAARDGVTRLEVGEDVWAITLYGDSAARLTAVLEAVRRDWPHVAWIRQLGLSRHCTPAALDRWLDPFLALGTYQTLDLSGDKFAQPIAVFKPIYRRAKAAGLRLKAHVGECADAPLRPCEAGAKIGGGHQPMPAEPDHRRPYRSRPRLSAKARLKEGQPQSEDRRAGSPELRQVSVRHYPQ